VRKFKVGGAHGIFEIIVIGRFPVFIQLPDPGSFYRVINIFHWIKFSFSVDEYYFNLSL